MEVPDFPVPKWVQVGTDKGENTITLCLMWIVDIIMMRQIIVLYKVVKTCKKK